MHCKNKSFPFSGVKPQTQQHKITTNQPGLTYQFRVAIGLVVTEGDSRQRGPGFDSLSSYKLNE